MNTVLALTCLRYLKNSLVEIMSALEIYLGVVFMKEGAKADVVRTYHSGVTE